MATSAEMEQMPSELAAGPIELRRRRLDHSAQLVAAMRASRPALARWFAWAQQEPTLEATRARASASEENFDAGADFEFVLIETDTGEVVGMLRVNPTSGPGEAEIGYWVRSDREGRGYATEATRAATTGTFAALSTIRVVRVAMDVANTRSAAVPRRLGFRLDHIEQRPIEAPGHSGRGQVWLMDRDQWPTG